MIYDISPVSNHQGNGSTINFDFNFYIDNVTQIKVYHFDENKIKRELVYELDYSISNVQNQNGGYITFPISGSSYDVLKASEQISIELNLPISQELEYNNSSDVNLDTLEYSFDYLTRLIQILKRKLSLCVKVEECSEVSPDVLIKNINDSHKVCSESATTIQKLKFNIDTALKLANNYYDKVENFTNELLSSNAYKLKTIQTTNCITELPQTINLEIVDGELVLKKGSTFILPNGAGNFERITTTADVKRATFSIGSYDEMYIQMHIPNSTGKAGLSFVLQNNVTVGTEQPTSGMWYNTNENKIVNYTSSGAENALRSFPIAVVKLESGVVTEIKQVFNGLGHFGN
ncbi:MAG: hypothetical protein IJW73_02700 [Candidatus Gastranaerophilales bacterium]|nr:hypothetical protein [Candidatus Gastranaerophilales bacterium]